MDIPAMDTDEETTCTRENKSQQILTNDHSDLITHVLQQLNVPYVFGVPGGNIEPLYNALARSKRRGGPQAIVSRHETGAAFMANGYSRVTGKLGVCCSTAGPGATNLLTGAACTYTDNLPILIITGQTALPSFGLNAAQESSCSSVNVPEMFRYCTRYSSLVSHPNQLKRKLIAAINHAFGSTPGPVHLSIPLDVLRTPLDADEDLQFPELFSVPPLPPNQQALKQLDKRLRACSKAAIVIGQDCRVAIKEVLAYANQRRWPVVTTPMGKGLLPALHPLYQGVFGFAGHEAATNALADDDVDYIIAVGTGLDECASAGWSPLILSNKLIHVDSNPEHLQQCTKGALKVLGCPKAAFSFLLKAPPPPSKNHLPNDQCKKFEHDLEKPIKIAPYLSRHEKKQCIDASKPIKPQALFWTLSQLCPADTHVAMDIGNSFIWGIHYWHCFKAAQDFENQFHISIGFGGMGFALGASIGIAMGRANKPTVCIVGDGSILMNGQEITVAQQQRLNILFVILNDAALGTVMHGQKLANAEQHCYQLPVIDYAAIYNIMGINSSRIVSLSELETIDIENIFKQPGPYVLDIAIDKDEVPPMSKRIATLNAEKNAQ